MIKKRNKTFQLIAGTLGLLFAMGAQASLTTFQTYTGTVGLSTDGFGASSNVGTLTANAPAGSTVIAAYLYSATYETFGTPTVTLNASTVAFGPRVGNPDVCCSLASFRANVTSIVKPIIDAGPGGAYNFSIAETGLGGSTDGEALVVVYSNSSLAVATVGILDGFSGASGDSTSINFATPLNPAAPGFFADMRLGIGFSCCDTQRSTVVVNGTTMTNNAGNYDDGLNLANGSLITMGGDNDAYSGHLPTYANDHERYNLVPYINSGDTSISIRTNNPSYDDNIFLATFWVSGLAGVNEPPPPPVNTPEPASLALMGLGLVGLGFARRRRPRS